MTAVRELMTRCACQRLKSARLSPIRVPPPMPCAISASRSTARPTSRSRSALETWHEAGVEDERLGLAEGVDDARAGSARRRRCRAPSNRRRRAAARDAADDACAAARRDRSACRRERRCDGWCAGRRAAGRARRARQRRTSRARMRRASRSASAWTFAVSSGSTMWRMSRLASACGGEAASRRSPLVDAPPASSSRAPLSFGSRRRFAAQTARQRLAARRACAGRPPARGWMRRMPTPARRRRTAHRSAASPSRVAQNSARSAALQQRGPPAGGRRQHGERVAAFGEADGEAVVARKAAKAASLAQPARDPNLGSGARGQSSA